MMESNDTLYTVSVYSENQVGLLSAICSIFTRRSINIWSLTVSASAIEGIHKFIITTYTTKPKIEAVVNQIEKRIDVIKAFYYTNDDIIYREVALYKVGTDALLESNKFEQIITKHHARIIEMNKSFTVIQKTGHSDETMELYNELSAISKVLQFVRSGRIAVTRSEYELVNEFLSQREQERQNINKQ